MAKQKTKTEMLIADIKQHFKSVSIKKNTVSVYDGVNDQTFVIESDLLSDPEANYTPTKGQALADLLWMNFKHIYGNEED